MVSLFRKTAQEWIQDKFPQLGAALAYYTIFSLAPLVLVLLAVFGLICGGSVQAREKVTDQLRYFIDPSGVKVFQDIAANASEPKEGILGVTPPFVKNCTLTTNRGDSAVSEVIVADDLRASGTAKAGESVT